MTLLKVVKHPEYVIIFDPDTGQEVLTGVNGFPDPFSLDFPSMMDVGIMGHCKNKCEFCYQGDEQEPNMKLDDFKQLVDEAEPYTMQFALGGRGDPNLHENFKEIIEYARAHKIIPNYTTSGSGLTDEQVEISKLCGAVAVSDYGMEFSFTALKKFMDAGIKTNIHFVLSRNSFNKAFSLINGTDVWGGEVDLERLNAVIFLLFKPQGRGKNLKHWSPSDDQVELLFEYIRMAGEANALTFKIGMDSCLVNRVQKVVELTDKEKTYLDTCEGARMSVYVTPDMKLVPCSFGDYVTDGVSLRDNFIYEAWHEGEPFNRFRKQLQDCPNSCPFGL